MMRSLGSVLLFALVAGAGAHAETQRAGFLVSVTVPERVVLEAVEQPAQLTISEADLRRGYKDVSARYLVRQNTSKGWMLRLSPRLGVTQQVEIRGLSTDLVLRAESLEIHRAASRSREDFSLEYRFVLDPDARPGSYDLPVHVSASPL